MSFRSLWDIADGDTKALVFRRKHRKCKALSTPVSFAYRDEVINSSDDEGRTALFIAVKYGETKLVKYLLERDANPGIATNGLEYPIHEAIDNGDIDIVELLINYGCDINCKNFLGQTPLVRAALFGDTETAKLLIKSGADLNCQEYTGKSALLVALHEGNDEISSMLIKKGCNVNIVGDHGQSALLTIINRQQKYSMTLCQKLFKAGYNFENDCTWLSKDLHRSIINTGVFSSLLHKLGFEKLKIDKDDMSGLLNDNWLHESCSRMI